MSWLRRRVERWYRRLAIEATADMEERVAEDLMLGMAIRDTREILPPRWALSVAMTQASATAAVFRPDAEGHAVPIHSEQRPTPTEAVDAIREWLR